MKEKIEKLNAVLTSIKSIFVGKDEIIDLMGICLVGRENLFMLGPPGTAKSAMVRELANHLQGKSFEYLLTRFTEPNELFGPFDIRKLKEGDLVTNTEGMLPEATLVFLDELLNANSAILNSLLTVLNERLFRRGKESRKLPALMMVGASNHLPEDEALQALFDRFLIRVHCDNVETGLLKDVLGAGWKLEQQNLGEKPTITAEEVSEIQSLLPMVDLSAVQETYIDLVVKLRNSGIKVSDRRAVKLQRLIASSALLCGRVKAIVSDLWVLRYIWDTDEQREIIAGIVNGVIESYGKTEEKKHPQAEKNPLPDADEIYKEVSEMDERWADENTTGSERTIMKDRLRHLNGRIEWIKNKERREYVRKPINALWEKILKRT